MPTRFIGSFPDHLKFISELIQKTKNDFYILVDCADYGSFSHPEGHKDFIEAIRAVRNRTDGKKAIDIEIRICGKCELISRSSNFWKDWQAVWKDKIPNAWDKLKNRPDFQKCLEEFCRNNEITKDSFDLNNYTKNNFVKLLKDKHKAIVKDLRRLKVKVGHCRGLQHRRAEIFFWMKDGDEAIFILTHTGTENQGLAFSTEDVNLMEIFKTTWKEHPTSPDMRLYGNW